MRRAEHGERIDLAAVHQFAQDQAGLDGLADADIVGDEQARHLQAKRHEQRNELIGAGLEGELGGGTERAGTATQRQAQRIREQRGLGLHGDARRRREGRSGPARPGVVQAGVRGWHRIVLAA